MADDPSARTSQPHTGSHDAWPQIGPVVHDHARIDRRVDDIASEVSSFYEGTTPVVVSVLKGATIFLADLTRRLTIEHELDFVAASIYGDGTTTVQAQILKDLQIPVAGRDVLLVEDIVDTGLTLRFVRRWLENHGPASVEVCTLLERPHRRITDEAIRFRGFALPDIFVVGYGFDYRQRFRNLRDLHELKLDDTTRELLLPV